jgi:hypothetical protein
VNDILWQGDADLILALLVHEGRQTPWLGIMINSENPVSKASIKSVDWTACEQDVEGESRETVWQL